MEDHEVIVSLVIVRPDFSSISAKSVFWCQASRLVENSNCKFCWTRSVYKNILSSKVLKRWLEEMAGTSFYIFWPFRFVPEMFSALSRLGGLSFVFLLVWLFIIMPFIRFWATSTAGWVSVRYNSLFISLPLFTKVHKTTTWNSHIPHIWENVNYTTANF